MQVAISFGFAALLLALVGIWGVVSYSVEQRKGELGLRLALGAEHARLLQLVMEYALVPVLLGLGCGLALSDLLGNLMRGLVFGVTASDPVITCSVSLLVILTSALACLVPARRVMKIQLASILRHQ